VFLEIPTLLNGFLTKQVFGNIKESFRQGFDAPLVIRMEIFFVGALTCCHFK
jgi:hypothetical protein